MTSDYTEDSLVEQPTIALFEGLGWETANAIGESATSCHVTGRETLNEVVPESRLSDALTTLNPDLPTEAINHAIQQLTRDRSAMTMVQGWRSYVGTRHVASLHGGFALRVD